MLVMADIFPEATIAEIKLSKVELTGYKKKKKAVEDFEKNPPETELQKSIYKNALKSTRNIERAVSQILKDDVKRIVEFRFIEGNSRAKTILRFSGLDRCDKTIDRKIEEGVISVANTLLYLE